MRKAVKAQYIAAALVSSPSGGNTNQSSTAATAAQPQLESAFPPRLAQLINSSALGQTDAPHSGQASSTRSPVKS